MPSTTTRLGLSYPLSTDADNVPGDMQTLADDLDGIITKFSSVSSLPAAGNAGFLYLLTTTNVFYLDDGSALVALNAAQTVTLYDSKTWAVTGTLSVTSGATEYLPPYVVPIPSGSGQTVSLVGVWASVRSGSATVSVSAGGSSVTSLGSLAVTTTNTYTAANGGTPVALSNGETIQPSITGVSSADGLQLSVVLEITVPA